MSNQNLKNKKVDWRVFIWVVGIIFLAIGWLFTISNNLQARVNATNHDITEVKIILEGIKTDLSWIKAEIGKINNFRK